MSSVRRMYENRLAERQRQEDFAKATNRQLAADRTIVGNYQSDERVDAMRRNRTQREIEAERAIQRRLDEEAERNEMRRIQQEEDERIAREEASRQREYLLDEKTRQRIRNDSEELRELEHKLKIAYMNKERATQRDAQRIMKEKQALEDKLFAKEEAAYRQHVEELEREKEMRRKEDRYINKNDLQEQMKIKEEKSKIEYENFLKEKLMIDEIVRKIHDEDQREMMERMKKQHETREYINQYLEDREEWKKRDDIKLAEENKNINEYVVKRQERDEETAMKKKQMQEQKEKIAEKLSEQIGSQRRKQEEMEAVRLELHIEEEQERQRNREKELLERRIQQRMDTLRTNEELQRIRAEIDRKHQAEEEAYGKRIMDEMAAADKLDQMNVQKARMKKLEHRREVERLLEERRQQYENERRQQVEEYIMAQQREEARRAIIEEERQRLLREHAVKLFGYLPKDLERELSQMGGAPRSPTPLARTPSSSTTPYSAPYNHSSQPQSRTLSPTLSSRGAPSPTMSARSADSRRYR